MLLFFIVHKYIDTTNYTNLTVENHLIIFSARMIFILLIFII